MKKDIRTLCELALGADSTDDWVYVAGPFLAKASNSVQKDPKRLVLIVDDLDRCKAECIAQVLDAIRLVMDLENVIVLIAIDHRIALKAIERHYRNVEKKEEADTDGGIAREYLGKIVHLTARLMRPDEHELGEYVIDL